MRVSIIQTYIIENKFKINNGLSTMTDQKFVHNHTYSSNYSTTTYVAEGLDFLFVLLCCLLLINNHIQNN